MENIWSILDFSEYNTMIIQKIEYFVQFDRPTFGSYFSNMCIYLVALTISLLLYQSDTWELWEWGLLEC